MRKRYYFDKKTQKMVPEEEYHPQKQTISTQIIIDDMPRTQHPSNGKFYTSKKKFRDETRARGLVEVGDQMHSVEKHRGYLEKVDSIRADREIVDSINKAFHQTGYWKS